MTVEKFSLLMVIVGFLFANGLIFFAIKDIKRGFDCNGKKAKEGELTGIVVSLIIGQMIAIKHFYDKYMYEIRHFFEDTIIPALKWSFWAIIITAVIIGAFYLLLKIIKINKEEKEKQRHIRQVLLNEKREKDKKEREIKKLKNIHQELKEQEKRVLHKLYNEKIEALVLLEAKNKQLVEDVETSKYAVSGISIYDNDFLNMQPQVLQYINDAIAQGKV